MAANSFTIRGNARAEPGSGLDKDIDFSLPEDAKKTYDQAETDYRVSFGYVNYLFRWLWNYSWKKFHLCEVDRDQKLKKESGNNARSKANVASGLSRQAIDTANSYMVDNPLVFNAKGLNEEGITNKQNISNALAYASDVTGFSRCVRDSVESGMIEGSFCWKVGWRKRGDKMTTTVMENGIPVKTEVDEDPYEGPYAYKVDLYSIFPDFYPTVTGQKRKLRHVTERGVCALDEFKEMFQGLIDSKDNKSPFCRNEKMLDLLPNNQNGASYEDYGWQKTEIFRSLNDELRSLDGFGASPSMSFDTTALTYSRIWNFGRDPELSSGLVEWRITYYKDRIVLRANNFPVYIGKNGVGFIPYTFCQFDSSYLPFGMPVPIILRDLDDTATSFLSAFIDNAKSVMNKALAVRRNLLLFPESMDKGIEAGQNIYITGNERASDVIAPIDRGTPEDFGVVNRMMQMAQGRSGVSDYNAGISSRERTAIGASALTESLLRRMTPYLKRVSDSVSDVAEMWLKLMRMWWTDEVLGYVLNEDGDQIKQTFTNSKLLGAVKINVENEGMISVNMETELKKLIDFYNTFAPSGFIKPSEVVIRAAKKSGLPTSIVVNREMTLPVGMNKGANGTSASEAMPEGSGNTMMEQGVDLQQAINPQISLDTQG